MHQNRGGMAVNEATTGVHEIVVSDRSRMNVSGVSGVDCFNEEMVVLNTSAGTLTISGDGLHISNLSLQEGRLQVSGTVRALEYSDHSPARGGLLRRIFR